MEKNQKVKNLTATEILKLNKNRVQQIPVSISVEVDNGMDDVEVTDYRFTYDSVFSMEKQYKVLDDMIAFYESIGMKDDVVHFATPYATLLIIKHYTSIHVPDKVDKALDVMHAMIELDILNKVLNALPEKQVVKVYKTLEMSLRRANETLVESEKESRRIQQQLDNEAVKKLASSNVMDIDKEFSDKVGE